MGIIKFILITLLVLYLLRLIIKLILPMVFVRLVNKVQQQAQQQQGGRANQQTSAQPEGSVHIDYIPPKPKRGNADKLGDFVDYEEVKS